jgi:hypothetical protein
MNARSDLDVTSVADSAAASLPHLPSLHLPPPPVSPPTAASVGDGMPFLPAAAPTPSVVAEPATFDAKAMVESQRHAVANPGYGALPAPSDANREAADHLRLMAQKKRRRNKRISRLAVVLVLAALGVLGWFVFQAYQDGEAERAAESAAEQAGDNDADALTPLGEQGAIIDAIEDLNGVTPGESGGLVGAIDDARDLTQAVPPTVTILGPNAPAPLPTPRVAHRPEFRTTGYVVRIYDGADPDATYRNFEVTYDTLTDDYFGFVDNTATGESELVSFDGEWRYSVGSDGVQRRVHRSEFSRSLEPDTPLASLLGEYDVFPRLARPHATLVSETLTDEPGVDGTPVTVYVYFVDVAAFRDADPESYATWRTLWATAPHDIVDLVEPGSAQVRPSEPMATDVLTGRPAADLSDFEIMPSEGQTAIAFSITEQGVITVAALISPEENLRIVYVATSYSDQSASMPFPQDGWVDAP